MRDEYWRPVDGFKLWPKNNQRLCGACIERIGEILETNLFAVPDGHTPETCAGLRAAPIICTVLNLKRRNGKTFNTAGYSLSTLGQSKNEHITYVAASEDQTHGLFVDNYEKVIKKDATLSKLFRVLGSSIQCKQTNSFFECVSTSHGSITGKGRTKIILDEARDIPARTAMALIPSVFDESGIECRHGHLRKRGPEYIEQLEEELLRCSVCHEPLTPWYARIIITSAQGMIEGGEKDWFAELVAWLKENPHPNYHLFSSTEDLNPSVSQDIVSAVEDVFSNLESTRDFIDVEINNLPRRKGEDFVTHAIVQRCCDKTLRNVEGHARKAFGFLDTSLSVEKTSLVVLSEDYELRRASDRPWARLITDRIDFWEPKKMKGGVIDESIIEAHLDLYMPMFPGMRLTVDTRLQPWAIRFVKRMRATKPGWGKRVFDFNGGPTERNAGWTILEDHLKAGTIRLIDHPELKKELAGVKKQRNVNNQVEVRDRNRKVRHADIAEGLAECCREAFLEGMKKRLSVAQTQTGDARAVRDQILPISIGRMSIDSY